MEFHDRRDDQMVLPGMEHLEPAPRAPEVDSALEKRRSKMYANRGYQRGLGAGRPYEVPTSMRQARDGRSVTPHMYGVDVTFLDEHHPNVRDAYNHFGAFDQKEYAAMGQTKLYARPDVSTLQGSVVQQRVEQIKANPAAGRGSRTPGFIQGIETNDGRVALTNGNHRAAADMARGALFLPVRSVPARSAPALARLYRERRKGQHKAAVQKAFDRLPTKDA